MNEFFNLVGWVREEVSLNRGLLLEKGVEVGVDGGLGDEVLEVFGFRHVERHGNRFLVVNVTILVVKSTVILKCPKLFV